MKKREENSVERLIRDFDADAVFCEIKEDMPKLVAVSPYNTKTGIWTSGMTLITSLEELKEAKIPKVCNDQDKFTMKVMGQMFPPLPPKKKSRKRK